MNQTNCESVSPDPALSMAADGALSGEPAVPLGQHTFNVAKAFALGWVTRASPTHGAGVAGAGSMEELRVSIGAVPTGSADGVMSALESMRHLGDAMAGIDLLSTAELHESMLEILIWR